MRTVSDHRGVHTAQEYREKLDRGSASGIQRPVTWNCLMDGAATADCTDAARFGPYP